MTLFTWDASCLRTPRRGSTDSPGTPVQPKLEAAHPPTPCSPSLSGGLASVFHFGASGAAALAPPCSPNHFCFPGRRAGRRLRNAESPFPRSPRAAAFLLCHGWEGGLAETGKADFAESPAASSASNGVLGERAAFTAGRRK